MERNGFVSAVGAMGGLLGIAFSIAKLAAVVAGAVWLYRHLL